LTKLRDDERPRWVGVEKRDESSRSPSRRSLAANGVAVHRQSSRVVSDIPLRRRRKGTWALERLHHIIYGPK
jgi:hypothetical protein